MLSLLYGYEYSGTISFPDTASKGGFKHLNVHIWTSEVTYPKYQVVVYHEKYSKKVEEFQTTGKPKDIYMKLFKKYKATTGNLFDEKKGDFIVEIENGKVYK